ncbi:MAG: hypothetical protein HOP13_20790 [Alphaproteobacteria bacterium]|nr:hypothetical protein [Alphaproteobacteria bacterium]
MSEIISVTFVAGVVLILVVYAILRVKPLRLLVLSGLGWFVSWLIGEYLSYLGVDEVAFRWITQMLAGEQAFGLGLMAGLTVLLVASVLRRMFGAR